MDHKRNVHAVKAHFQVVAFLIASALIAVIFYTKTVNFYGFDRLPVVKEFTQSAKADVPIVHMGLQISSFSEFKMAKGEFAFAGSIWFQYDPKKIALKDIKKFQLVHGKISSMSAPKVKSIGDHEVAQFEITATFKNRLNYAAFPLGDHYVNIGVVNYALPEGTMFESASDDFDIEESVHIPGWRILSRKIKTGFVDRFFGKDKLHHTEQAGIFFILECKRTDPVFLITILVSLMLILLVSMIPFSMEEYSGDLISGAIGGIVAFRFVIAALSPKYVGYFMLVDYMFILALISVMVAVLGCIMARQFNWSERLQNGMVVGVYSFFVLGSWLSLFVIERI